MIKKYALIFVIFSGMVFSGWSQCSESFSNIPTSSPNQYQSRSWTGDDGLIWTANAARTDQMLNGKAICTTGGGVITSSTYPNGIGVLSFQYVRGFTSTNARSISVWVNGVQIGGAIVVDPGSNTVSTYSNPLFISGNVSLELRTNGAQVIIDNISWTASSAATVDFCNLQFPEKGNINAYNPFDVYAQVYKSGITEAVGPRSGITAWIGYSAFNSNPNNMEWTWIPATYHGDSGNNDEYVANIGSGLSSGDYYYASRFQMDDGPFTYGGYNETGGGFWDGTTNTNGFLSVDTVDFCNLQYPGSGTILLGNPYSVYGQVYEENVTPGTGQGAGIEMQVGYHINNTNPSTWTNWINGTYNAACADCNFNQNDEYAADLGSTITDYGTYYYATRFRINNGIWRYGGILADGSAGSFWDGETYISGILEVKAPEIRVEGNLGSFPEIKNGDVLPLGTDNTLFSAQFIGASQTKSYRIHNLGNYELNISAITILGPDSGDFTIIAPPASIILPGAFTTFEIQFSPLAAGQRNAIVSITNDDADENPYTFAIRGNGRCVTTSTTISPSSGPVGTIVTINGSDFNVTTAAQINGLPMPTHFISSTTLEVTIPENALTGHIVVTNALGCTSTLPITVLHNKIGGCEASSSLSDIFISEITDATTGGLTYIELYNGTGVIQNLNGYDIAIYNNGATTASTVIPLSPVDLLPNATFVLAIGVDQNPTASSICTKPGGNGQLAQQKSSLFGINKKDNEHDMIQLRKAGGTIVVDQFGLYMDPNWMDSSGITGDRGFNFRRFNNAPLLPNPNFDMADWNIIDWVGSGTASCQYNDYSDIGQYDYSDGLSPIIVMHPEIESANCQLSLTLSVSANEGISGGLPLTYHWFYNVPGTSEWSEISTSDLNYSGQQTAQLKILNTLDHEGYQYYAQVREDGITCFTASNATRLKVEHTIWNGTHWSHGAPGSETVVIVNADYTTSSSHGSFTGCSLVVNSGHTLNITDNYYVEILNDVKIYGNTTANFGQIIIETKGGFIQRGDGASAGTFELINTAKAQVNKTTALKQKWYDYTYWGSPVTHETAESAFSMASSSRRFYFEAQNYEDLDGDDIDDNGDDWQLATGRLIPGVGYASTSNASGIFPKTDVSSFQGVFNTGDIAVPIYTNNTLTDKDFNFLGNPYASAIDFKSLFNENMNVIEGSAFLWSQAQPPLATNPGNQKLNFNTSDYAIITAGSGNIAGGSRETPTDNIPSGQGFFVIGKDTGGPLTFKNSMRVAGDGENSQFFRNEISQLSNKFWINLSSDNGVFNQILVAYVDGATDAFDSYAYDAERNASSDVSAILYTQIKESGKKYAIQGKAPASLHSEEQVRLGFKTSISQPTLYTLAIAQQQGSFFENHMLFIKDQMLNIDHNLTLSDYHFTSVPGEFNDRFIVFFGYQTLNVESRVKDEEILKIQELPGGQMEFSVTENLEIKIIDIFDVLGRHLIVLHGSNATETFNLRNLSQSVYIAKVQLSNGKVISKRWLKNK